MSDLFDFQTLTPRFAVMGNPVKHSKSPQIHKLFGEQCDVDLDYQAVHVDLGGFTQALSGFQAGGGKGVNITIPFKVEAFESCDRLSDRARLAQAVNTIRFEHDGASFGDNTDGIGLLADIQVNHSICLAGKSVLVLGAGGAVRGVLGPLLDAQPSTLTIANRTVDKAVSLANHFAEKSSIRACGYEKLDGELFDIVVNATGAGLQGEVPPLPEKLFKANALAYDMVYADKPTPFVNWSRKHHAANSTDGLGMLVEQAAAAFDIWHGVRPDTAPVITALRSQ